MHALDGIRVLDLTRLLPGPFASLVLADLGASVDRVEDPGGSDYLRLMPPQVAGQSSAFHALNRDKRSLVLDLKHEAGKAAFLRLVTHYDVVFEQFRPGVLERLGIGHAKLLERNPRLVICALTGYGQHGPLRDRAGHDLNYLARSGVLGLQGPAQEAPQVPAVQMADVGGGLWSVIAILAALRERDRSGHGQVLDIAMTDGVLPFASLAVAKLLGGELPLRGGEVLSGGIAAYATYRTKDDRYVALAALEPKFLAKFCSGAGLAFDTLALVPGPHQAEIHERFAQVFASRSRDEWQAFSEMYDCCLEPVLEPAELRADPHLAARKLFLDLDAGGTPSAQFRTPVTKPSLEGRQPAFMAGEHSTVILQEAGFAPDEIEALCAAGAVGRP
jgi:alpha-methylacyl-CoA racemase